eukprot:m.37726 g.37726  ORF g.37726 m.37726 type:complete len:582 (+) comp17745_c0_seq1:211-1956(+)
MSGGEVDACEKLPINRNLDELSDDEAMHVANLQPDQEEHEHNKNAFLSDMALETSLDALSIDGDVLHVDKNIDIPPPSPRRTLCVQVPAELNSPRKTPADGTTGSIPHPATPGSNLNPAKNDEVRRARQLQAVFNNSPRRNDNRNSSLSSTQSLPSALPDQQFPSVLAASGNLASITVFVGTWNMNNRKHITQPFTDFLKPGYDLYMIGTQECSLDREVLQSKILDTLGDDYIQLHLQELIAIKLCAFVKCDVSKHIGRIESADISTKLGGMLKTKGAVGMSFRIVDTTFLFINSHLAPHQNAVGERNKDFRTICAGLPLPHQDHLEQTFQLISTAARRERNVTDLFDRVFWMGDLNYRVDMSREDAEKQISTNDFESMLAHDQLKKEMTAENTFNHFSETQIKFKPTYKFDRNTTVYDTSEKQRVPSWTDRILVRSSASQQEAIEWLAYDSCPAMLESDHRPVYGAFKVSIDGGQWKFRRPVEPETAHNLMKAVSAFQQTNQTESDSGVTQLTTNQRRNSANPKRSSNVSAPDLTSPPTRARSVTFSPDEPKATNRPPNSTAARKRGKQTRASSSVCSIS